MRTQASRGAGSLLPPEAPSSPHVSRSPGVGRSPHPDSRPHAQPHPHSRVRQGLRVCAGVSRGPRKRGAHLLCGPPERGTKRTQQVATGHMAPGPLQAVCVPGLPLPQAGDRHPSGGPVNDRGGGRMPSPGTHLQTLQVQLRCSRAPLPTPAFPAFPAFHRQGPPGPSVASLPMLTSTSAASQEPPLPQTPSRAQAHLTPVGWDRARRWSTCLT